MTGVSWGALTLVFALILMASQHVLAMVRWPDRGAFWARQFAGVALGLGPVTLLGGWVTGSASSFVLPLYLSLIGPLALWALLGVGWALVGPRGKRGGRWIAGDLGYVMGRGWVLLLTIPASLLLLTLWRSLDVGAGSARGLHWSMVLAATLSLLGVAFSRPPPNAVEPEASEVENANVEPLLDWPQRVRAQGLVIAELGGWEGDGQKGRGPGTSGPDPAVIEAILQLAGLGGRSSEGRRSLVMAADDAGQVEGVCELASRVARVEGALTLVVVPESPELLTARLRATLPSGIRVAAERPNQLAHADVSVWVISAGALSDHLNQLTRSETARRIGLVVWWDLHDYSGVRAANMWAVSRRLHRVTRPDTRILALMRPGDGTQAQALRFVNRLIPIGLSAERVHAPPPRMPRTVRLYLLESHAGALARLGGRVPSEGSMLGPLVCALASARTGWSTWIGSAGATSLSEQQAVLRLDVDGQRLSDRLAQAFSRAGASIHVIEARDVLSLRAALSEGGRDEPRTPVHHALLIPPQDPYARWLLSRVGSGQSPEARRRLVGAEANPAIIRRHLLHALSERSDTRSGLRATFLWQDAVIESALEDLGRQRKLERNSVRYLDAEDQLVEDDLFTSRADPGSAVQGLETMGGDLVELRSVGGDPDEQGVLLRVDPERLSILAYPGRIFMAGGRRYRVRDWHTGSALTQRWIGCELDEAPVRTVRRRSASVSNLRTVGGQHRSSLGGALLTWQRIDLHYRESVSGYVQIRLDGDGDPLPAARAPVRVEFDTIGVLLHMPQSAGERELASLAQALRHVLPVHVGIDSDAIEIVPVRGTLLDQSRASGLVIADLYPGGLGLIDAILQDDVLFLDLFRWTRDWLHACGCRSERGCARCLASPDALGPNPEGAHTRRAALDILDLFLPHDRSV